MDANNLHHAYFLLGEEKEAEDLIGSLFLNLGITPVGNPDVHIYRDKTFGIDEARILKQRAEAKAFGNKKFFVIYSPLITGEAQNALLKVFEEPNRDTHFIIVSSKNLLLPTLLSRLQTIRLNSAKKTDSLVKEFLHGDVKNRMQIIKDETQSDSFSLPSFLDQILSELSKNPHNLSETKKVYEVSKFANDPAANSRMILEHLALTLKERLEY